MSITDIAQTLGMPRATVQHQLEEIRIDYNGANPHAVNEMREADRARLYALRDKIEDDILAQLANPEADRVAIAQLVRAVTGVYERIHKMFGVDAPRQVNVNAKIATIAAQIGISPERLTRKVLEIAPQVLGE